MRRVRIEAFQNLATSQGWFWHIKAANGEIICQGEGHATRANAERAAKGVVRRIIGPSCFINFYRIKDGSTIVWDIV